MNNYLYFNDGRVDLEILRYEKLPETKIPKKHLPCKISDVLNASHPKKFMEFLSTIKGGSNE